MKREESLYPKDWFNIGNKELERARKLLMLGDPEGAGFNIHQAVEKYLKGYLLSMGWKLRRIHELDVLISEAALQDPSFEEFRTACQKMTDYYVEERYPFMVKSDLTVDEVRESLAVAETIVARVMALVE